MRYARAVLLVLMVCQVQMVEATPRTYTGFAARYSPGVMARVARNRGIKPQDCMIAATFEPLKSWVTVTGLRTRNTVRCQVVDQVHPRDRKEVIRRGIVVELAHEWAVPLCGSAVEKPERCNVAVERIR